jgi:PAS domain S-box-containing protein
MEVRTNHPTEEIKHLRRCINDLVSLLALPAMWSGSDSSRVVGTLMDVLSGMLHLDLVYVRVKDSANHAPAEMVRVAQSRKLSAGPREIGELLIQRLGPDPSKWPSLARILFDDEDLVIVPIRLGLQGEVGTIVAGSRRADFPQQTEILILNVAANQAAIGLQEARLLSEQKRVADELDRRVAQRTVELATANEELKKEIAERILVEEKLRRSEAFLAEGQHLNLSGSFSWRLDTDEITFSEELRRIFAFEQDSPVTITLMRSRVHSEDIALFSEKIAGARRDGSDHDYEIRLRMPDGSVKYLHIISHKILDQGGRSEYVGAVQDVTQRRLSEETLAQARSELAHMTRITSLGGLTASIAHEVNQPLAAIVTNGESGLRWLARPDPNVFKVQELTERMVADARRASEIIDRIRGMATPRAPESTLLSLDDVVKQSIIFLRPELQLKGISVSLDLAPTLPHVVGDRTLLQQVIVNLTMNAVQAITQAGGVRQRIFVQTMLSNPGTVSCFVEDSGPGIDPTHLSRLFDNFFTTKDNGMGMGLAISRSIIEAHNGHIQADNNSSLGGARFSFSLPAIATQ